MALNIDFAPTILDFAGQSFDDLDGESLVPILRDPALPGRRDFLIEHMQFIRPIGKDEKVPSYCALRTKTRKLVVYATGEREFYDLIADPEEVHNLAAEPGSAAAMQDLMPRLIELCNPMPPGFPADVLV